MKLCHLKDNSKTSTRAVRQNASVVRTLCDLFTCSLLLFFSFLCFSFGTNFFYQQWVLDFLGLLIQESELFGSLAKSGSANDILKTFEGEKMGPSALGQGAYKHTPFEADGPLL